MEEEYLENLKQRAEQGDAVAQWNLGKIKWNKGFIDEAMDLYKKAADQNFVLALFDLSMIYAAKNSDSDKIKAFVLCKKAAENIFPHPPALYHLGYMYEFGKGVEQDKKAAIKCYLQAALLDEPNAQRRLGYKYYYGEDIEKNYAAAIKWFKEAAKRKDSFAECQIAHMYYNGEGVAKDKEEAEQWYKQSSEHANIEAQSILEEILFEEKANQIREEFFCKFNDMNQSKFEEELDNSIILPDIQYKVGIMFFYGLGVSQDNAFALKLIKQSACYKYAPALEFLQERKINY